MVAVVVSFFSPLAVRAGRLAHLGRERELLRLDRRARVEVVLDGLEALLPGVEVGRRDARHGGLLDVVVEALGLADVRRARGGLVDDGLHGHVPGGLEDVLHGLGHARDAHEAAAVGDDVVLFSVLADDVIMLNLPSSPLLLDIEHHLVPLGVSFLSLLLCLLQSLLE